MARRLWFLALAIAIVLVLNAPAFAQNDPSSTTLPAGGGSAITGQLLDGDDNPVPDVEILVEQDGPEIGRAISGADGFFRIAVPAAGTYQVTLIVDTLPDGVALRDESLATLSRVRVREGLEKPVRFLLGEGAGSGVSTIEQFANLTSDGLRLGLILSVASIGLSLIFGVTGLTNFAHGELVTFGALVAYFASTSAAGPGLPLILAALVATAFGGAFGFAHERLLFRPLRRRRSGNVALIVVTIGLGLFLRNFYLLVFDGSPRPFDEYTVQRGLDLGLISPRAKDLAIIAVALAVLLAYGIALRRTRLGTAMRAVADDRDLAESSGIDVERVILVTWSGGGALAALGGVLVGLSDTVQFDMGFGLLLPMFAAVIVGGLGTAYGPLVGGVLIGLVSQLSTYWLSPKYRIGVALAVLIIAVLLRPQGILGRRERIT